MAERNRLLVSPEDDFAYGQGIPADATWRNLIPFAEFGLGMSPGSGEAMSARDAWDASGRAGNALLSGDYGQAASDYLNMGTGILGAIPGAGFIARGTKRGAAWMDRNLPEGFNRLLDYVYPSDPRNTTMIFAGPTAKTADHAALAKAQEMKAQGASRADIWRETGWDLEKADQIPRFEIDDSGSRWAGPRPEDMTPGMSIRDTSGNLLPHENLARAYPETTDMRVQYLRPTNPSFSAGSSGAYRAEGPGYAIANSANPGDPRSIGLHELQHHVQTVEGFAQGGNWRDAVNSPEGRALADKIYRETKRRGSNMADEDIRANAEIAAGRAIYNRLAGEVEARNVQSRMNMSAAERRATPPWETQDVPDEQQIVRFR